MPLYRIWCETEATHVETWALTLPTVCPNDDGHTIDPNKTSIISVDAISLPQRLDKIERVQRMSNRLGTLKADSFLDDFEDATGIDDAESSGYELHPEGFVKVAGGQPSATLVSILVETISTHHAAFLAVVVHQGSPVFYLSGDDGVTWTEVTSFLDETVISGKEWRVKAELNPGDQLAAWAFDLH